jgi:hypothetical protein
MENVYPFERQILLERYVEGRPPSDIMQRYGDAVGAKSNLCRLMNEAMRKIREKGAKRDDR